MSDKATYKLFAMVIVDEAEEGNGWLIGLNLWVFCFSMKSPDEGTDGGSPIS